MAYANLNYTADQINEAVGKALEGSGGGGSASIPVVVVEGATPTQELQPNTYYEFGEVTSLTITLAPEQEGIYNEYMFEFTSGTTATTLNLPSDIKWVDNKIPVIEINKKYQVSILNDIGVIAATTDKEVFTAELQCSAITNISGFFIDDINYSTGFSIIEYFIGSNVRIEAGGENAFFVLNYEDGDSLRKECTPYNSVSHIIEKKLTSILIGSIAGGTGA